jgi:hypothetical protein
MDNMKRAEAFAAANPRKGNRVTLDQVLFSIKQTYYFHPAAAVPDPGHLPKDHVMWTMTVCVCILYNGWSVIGKAAPADPTMFDEEIGRKLAYEDCVRQIWPLLGFLLRQTLYEMDGPLETSD